MAVYTSEKELQTAVKRAGGVRVVALRAGMRPTTLWNKLSGWSILLPEERQRVLNAIHFIHEEQNSMMESGETGAAS
jgi:predicted Abi (CAAX) family protease